jgi:hypothetical protein
MPVIQATGEVEITRKAIRGHPRQKVSKTCISTNKLAVVVQDYNTSYAGGIAEV